MNPIKDAPECPTDILIKCFTISLAVFPELCSFSSIQMELDLVDLRKEIASALASFHTDYCSLLVLKSLLCFDVFAACFDRALCTERVFIKSFVAILTTTCVH